MQAHRIRPCNVYNMDEKGFLIGICGSKRRIASRAMLANEKLLGACQDGSREFISLVACICADGTALSPALIYAGKSRDLQDAWVEDFDHSIDQAFFASSEKGWTNEELGVSWLQHVFLRETNAKAGMRNRLLILDGHSSHVNWRFIDICDQNHIILGILPPHSTHRLQPLDLRIFSPLSIAYSNEIDKILQSSIGFSRITKRSFWSLFKAAWSSALTEKNVLSAFTAAGIHPLDPTIVLDKFACSTLSPSSSDGETHLATPTSVRAVRRHIKTLKKTHGEFGAQIDLLARATEKLSLQLNVAHHENIGLRNALVLEQKRRKRGGKMGIFDKDERGQAVFASPGKIAAARTRRQEEEEQKAAAEEGKEREREAKAMEKVRKAQEVQERREAREEQVAHRKALREEAKETRKQQKEANAQVKAEEKASAERGKAEAAAAKQGASSGKETGEGVQKQGHVRSGRNITLPKRFTD